MFSLHKLRPRYLQNVFHAKEIFRGYPITIYCFKNQQMRKVFSLFASTHEGVIPDNSSLSLTFRYSASMYISVQNKKKKIQIHNSIIENTLLILFSSKFYSIKIATYIKQESNKRAQKQNHERTTNMATLPQFPYHVDGTFKPLLNITLHFNYKGYNVLAIYFYSYYHPFVSR